jgi:hypothetical protein
VSFIASEDGGWPAEDKGDPGLPGEPRPGS